MTKPKAQATGRRLEPGQEDAPGRPDKKPLGSPRRRQIVADPAVLYGVSVRRACRATGFPRSTQHYRARREPQDPLRLRLRELAAARVRSGYRRLHVSLRREGWSINPKRVYRLYRLERLTIMQGWGRPDG